MTSASHGRTTLRSVKWFLAKNVWSAPTTLYENNVNKNRIIIVTEQFDPHSDEIILALRALNQEPIRLNSDDIPRNIELSFNVDAAWTGVIKIKTNGRNIDIGDIRSIWWRRPKQFVVPDQFSKQEIEFARGELNHTFQSLWVSLDCYWISNPNNIRLAGWKGEQLKRAVQFGFEIPKTLITNNKDDVLEFFERCRGKIIFKVLSDPSLAMEGTKYQQVEGRKLVKAVYTTLITENELEHLDSVQLVPCQFQEYIPKLFELRVIVIGDEIFAVEIHSQAHQKTSIDWRHYDVDIPYRKAQLPPEVKAQCLAYVKSYGLNYSAIDLIFTPDGRYIFLENNPNGQFLFLEKKVPELKMTDALCACLIRGSN